jgi:steroid delta-isomerase-like uncharacterized protein
MTQTTADLESTLQTYGNIWNERNYDDIPDVVAEDFTLLDPAAPGGEVHGHDGLESFIRETVSRFSDFHAEVVDMLVGEDTVMLEVRYRMTHDGEFDGIPPTNTTVEFTGMGKVRLTDGKVQEHHVYFDRQAVQEQLGRADVTE